MHRSWRSCWPCPPCPPGAPVWEHLGAGTEQSETPRTRGSRWGRGLLLDTQTHDRVKRSLNEAQARTSARTAEVRRKQTKEQIQNSQNHAGPWGSGGSSVRRGEETPDSSGTKPLKL